MSEPREIRCKRLKMRSMRRGIKEMDLIFSAFADARLDRMDEAELDLYEELLAENDQDILAWVTDQTAPPNRFAHLLGDIVSNFNS